MREYGAFETVRANLPYVGMLALGGLVLGYGYGFSAGALAAAGGYVGYGILGALWIMVFVCPYCAYYDSRGCPCGYGKLAARMVGKGDRNCFSEKFKRHIPVIVPLWVIPVVGGVFAFGRGFSWWLVGLLVLFAANSYVILPWLSKKCSCAECPQKEDCPWMGKAGQAVESVAASE